MSKRAGIGLAALTFILLGSRSPDPEKPEEPPTENPRPPVKPEEADRIATTTEELDTHLRDAKDGEVVWVEEGEYDISDISPNFGAITLASNRSVNGGDGALLYSDTFGPPKLVAEKNARITGLRIRGPESGHVDAEYSPGIWFKQGGELDNCEVFNWPYSGVFCGTHESFGGTTEIHDCEFHHCRAKGSGYGAYVLRGQMNIERCTFDYHRRAIAGIGYADSHYTVKNCVHGTWTRYNVVDMHGAKDHGWTGLTAGGECHVEDCTFLQDRGSIVVRGIPSVGFWIERNHFVRREKPDPPGTYKDAFYQSKHESDSFERVHASLNAYSGDKNAEDVGATKEMLMRMASRPYF